MKIGSFGWLITSSTTSSSSIILFLEQLLLRLILVVVLVPSFFNVVIVVVHGHPGGVANGRASCGIEYSKPDVAYKIPDVQEAWYLRRIATCESPVFWTQFEIKDVNQPLYVAVISPELERFTDQLKFHGILYGPGMTASEDNGFLPIPEELPPGIIR